jgi:hypothetical protein
VYITCWVLLFVAGLFVGGNAPIWWLLANTGDVRGTVCRAPVVFTVIALGTELFCRRCRSWLRPLVWGAVAGALVILVQLWLDGWQIDLTV